ncbi:hypothetical protein MMC10_002218 [Thelotrema lepadinum]|nr:hypothetical protein [Thelotrema lepadinum]
MEGERTSLLTRLPELVRDSRLEASLSSEGSIIHLHHDRPGRRARPRQERWTVTRRLGRGSYGIVSLIEAEQQGATTFRAVKRITYQSPTSVAYYQHELETLAKFSNPRVTRFVRCFVQSFGWFEANQSLYIEMEYCQLGDLEDYICTNGQLQESEAQEIIGQVTEGLWIMHGEGFAHRDLNPKNVLIKSHPPEEDWWIKLCDFGLSKRSREATGGSVVGTPGFLAPEIEFESEFLGQYPNAPDVWSNPGSFENPTEDARPSQASGVWTTPLPSTHDPDISNNMRREVRHDASDSGRTIRQEPNVQEEHTPMRVAASHDSPNYPSYNHDIPPNMEETVLSGMQLPERAGPLALSSRSSSFMQKVLGKTSAKANTQIETLCQAGRAGDLPRAKRLVAAGANLNGHDRHDGYTPLGVAVQHNRVAVAKFFLENGANPDEGYKEKWKAKSTLSNKKHSLSPLHLAARSGYAKLVDLLVEHGADVHNASGCWHNHANFTPLQQSRKEATRSLLVHGASAVSQDGSGWFPLADAAFGCRLSCVKTLIEFGALACDRGITSDYQVFD